MESSGGETFLCLSDPVITSNNWSESQDGVVDIATSLQAGWQELWFSFWQGQETCLFSKSSIHTASCSVDMEALSLRVKEPKH